LQDDNNFNYRRTIRVSRLLSEVGHTDILEALEELKALRAASQQLNTVDADKQCTCQYPYLGMPGCPVHNPSKLVRTTD